MKSNLWMLLLLAGSLLLAGPAFGHHASSNYDREHPMTFTGTVTQFEFANPHVLIHFDAKDENGVMQHWVAQTGPPQQLFKVGWNRESLKAGDPITIKGLPSKDGKKVLPVRQLKPPKGEDLTIGNE